MYEDSIREEFTRQSGSFGKAAVMTSAETLGALVELVPADAEARWLESACGTGLVSRALAGKVGSVTGVDLTPAMLEQAKRGAAERGDRERRAFPSVTPPRSSSPMARSTAP